jgi:hypothetical protein
MSAPTYNTWEGDTGNGINPRRPSTDDLGGDELENDPKYTPTPNEMPTAEAWNQQVKQIAALARVAPAAILEVTNGGTPSIASVYGPNAALVPGDFTVTDMGAGITKIEPDAGKLPVQTWKPWAQILGNNGGGANTSGTAVEIISTGWIVRTSRNNTLVDVDFVLHVSGL